MRTARAPPGGGKPTTIADAVRALVAPARKLDKARAKLKEQPRNEQVRAELDEAMRRVQTHPTAENLERLAEATKKMRRGSPAREKAQAAHDEAQREFLAAYVALKRAAEAETR